MAKKAKIYLLLPLLAFLASCSSTQTEMDEELASLQEGKIELAKAFVANMKYKVSVTPLNGQLLRNTFKVTRSDLQTLLAQPSTQTAKSAATSDVCSIEPVVYKGDTIMYLVNYNQGWKLYSVDKRMPTVLAVNYVERGKRASDILQNKAISSWVSDIAGQTSYLATTDEYDENSESLEQWATQGRGIKRIPYQPVPGEYIYVGREEVSRQTVLVPHVTKTLWHQEEPFNKYCPTISANSEMRCPTGCVAVATSQYLYFLQDKLGYSFNMPLLGSCIGAHNENYIQSFTRFATWDLSALPLTDNTIQYSSDQFDRAALVIGYAAKQVRMAFGPSGSGTLYANAQSFLNSVGVKGKFVEWKDINLENIVGVRKEPVITRGTSDTLAIGHMFMIDGCKYDLVEYEDVWRFLEDTTFYDPDRYGVILREKVYGTYKQDYAYQCNFGWNLSFYPSGSDADDTYYVISEIQGFNTNRRYFKLEK